MREPPGRDSTQEDLCRHLTEQSDSPPRVLVKRLEGLAVSQGAVGLRDDVAILAARVEP